MESKLLDRQTEGQKFIHNHVIARLGLAKPIVFFHRSNLSRVRIWDRLLRSVNPFTSMQFMSRKDLKAFTLAEVLITLGIIGIVAEMTIPSLMNSVGDQVNKVGYKKAYSVASQAWLMAYNEGDVTNCTDWFDGSCNKTNFDGFKKQVKISKDCGNDTASCWNMSGEKSWTNQWPSTSANSFIDPSGFAWTQLRNSSDTTPEILVDTNGDKKPNKYGKDRAIFRLWYDPNTSAPKVYIIQDCPGVATAEMDINNQNLVCPSNATSPCWYTSWITGAK